MDITYTDDKGVIHSVSLEEFENLNNNKMGKYKWHGEPVKVEFGYCEVSENREKPMYWYNYECYTGDYVVGADGLKSIIVDALRVTYHDQVFCIANHFGIGVHKLINGGWPNFRHYSLPTDGFKEYTDWRMKIDILKFNEEDFSSYECGRKKWQKKSFPEEFAKQEELINSMRQFIKKLEV